MTIHDFAKSIGIPTITVNRQIHRTGEVIWTGRQHVVYERVKGWCRENACVNPSTGLYENMDRTYSVEFFRQKTANWYAVTIYKL